MNGQYPVGDRALYPIRPWPDLSTLPEQASRLHSYLDQVRGDAIAPGTAQHRQAAQEIGLLAR
jgi:hypothetical protein